MRATSAIALVFALLPLAFAAAAPQVPPPTPASSNTTSPTSTSTANATIHTVIIGAEGKTFDPALVNATQGDYIAFSFAAGNHSVTQTSFAQPCVPLAGGLNSNFTSVAAGAAPKVLMIQLTNTSAPLWFACMQTGHCQSGMVFAVNPTAEKTFDSFKATAIGQNLTTGAPTSAPPASGSAASTRATVGALLAALAMGLLAVAV